MTKPVDSSTQPPSALELAKFLAEHAVNDPLELLVRACSHAALDHDRYVSKDLARATDFVHLSTLKAAQELALTPEQTAAAQAALDSLRVRIASREDAFDRWVAEMWRQPVNETRAMMDMPRVELPGTPFPSDPQQVAEWLARLVDSVTRFLQVKASGTVN